MSVAVFVPYTLYMVLRMNDQSLLKTTIWTQTYTYLFTWQK